MIKALSVHKLAGLLCHSISFYKSNNLLTVWRSCSREIGLIRILWALSDSMRGNSSSDPVINTFLMVGLFVFRASMTSKPSQLGMRMSMMAKSTGKLLAIPIASSPSDARRTT